MFTVKNKKVGILGLGKSGQSALKLLLWGGAKTIYGFDVRKIDRLLNRKRVKFFFGPPQKFLSRLEELDFLIKSPGVPDENVLLQYARKRKKKIFSELFLGLQFSQPGKIIAVTGTNGKTTTASLIGHILSKTGLKVVVAGNIGKPLTALVKKISPETILVLEVSSYQLLDTKNFHPDIAVVLNITPDHLEHHRTFSKYIQAKKIITRNQTENDFLILNYDDRIVRKFSSRARIYYFSTRKKVTSGIYLEGNNFILVEKGQKIGKIPARSLKLPGKHNQENALAAILAVYLSGLDPGLIARFLKSFTGVTHRLETVGTYRGVTYVNDSKATNVESTLVALKSFPKKNIWLILGGLGKGFPYTPLRPLIKEKVKGILLIGQDSPRIASDLKGTAPIYECQNLRRAVTTAKQLSRRGDIVLLSPACASFDQFKNFEERGRIFKQLVKHLSQL